MVRRKQDAWYNEILQQSRLVESTSRQLFLQAKDQRDQRTRQELEAYQRRIEQTQVDRQARLAEEAEEQRLALEQRRVLEAAEEAQRAHLAAEEEQRRRERERECAVCLEVNDITDMVEVPCGHWYCPDHLRGKKYPASKASMCIQLNNDRRIPNRIPRSNSFPMLSYDSSNRQSTRDPPSRLLCPVQQPSRGKASNKSDVLFQSTLWCICT